MKKIFVILLFLISFFSFSQESKKIVEQQFLDYNQLISKKDFSKALETYAPLEFLEIFPKDMLVQAFEQMFNSPEMKFTLYAPTIENIFLMDKKIENLNYAKVFYSQKMDVEMDDVVNSNEAESKKSKIKLYLNLFKSQFGENNALFNKDTEKFEVISQKMAIAASKDEKNWKFTIAEKKQEQILRKFIPLELLKDLK